MSDRFGKNPMAWLFHVSLLLLGVSIALNLAIDYLRPTLPWLLGGLAIASLVWIAVAVIRWRRSRW